MGIPESTRSESQNPIITSLRKGKVQSSNSGVCAEQDYQGIKLNLGSGNCHWKEWVNIDLYDERSDLKCDLAKLNFPDNYADVAAAIHVVEHFYEWELIDVLKEWKRVLAPNGKLILELPSMNKVLNYMRDCMNIGEPIHPSFSWFAFYGDPRYNSVPMCHKWGYTEDMISERLIKAGFVNISFETPNYHFPMRDMRVVAYKGE